MIHPNKIKFDEALSALAERNWKVRRLLTDVGTYEKQNENIRRLIDKELGVKEWVTYPIFKEDGE